MKFKFYQAVGDVKHLPHVWVFSSDKSNILTTDSARIARSLYGRSLNNASGLEVTPNGRSYGVVVREENRFSLVNSEELVENFIKVYGYAMADKEHVYVLPNFLTSVLQHQLAGVQNQIRDVFIKCEDKSRFILPIAWKRAFHLA